MRLYSTSSVVQCIKLAAAGVTVSSTFPYFIVSRSDLAIYELHTNSSRWIDYIAKYSDTAEQDWNAHGLIAN